MIAFARLKRAARAAIAICGGIDGARATVERVGRTQVGNWNALNHPDLPMLHDAFALDEIAVIEGKTPPILFAYAAELGHVALRLPDPDLGTDAVTGAMIDASAEFGDIAIRLRDALADGELDDRERVAIATEVDQAQAALSTLKALVLRMGDEPREGA